MREEAKKKNNLRERNSDKNSLMLEAATSVTT
jgi:hypothetical protein